MRLSALVLLPLTLLKCEGGRESCTEEFRFFIVAVLSQGEPVTDAKTQTVLVKTGQVLEENSGKGLADPSRGLYILISDSAKMLLSSGQHTVRFEVRSSLGIANIDYKVVADSCHITGFEGPDRITLE